MPNAHDILRRLVERAPAGVSIDELAPFAPKSHERQLVLQAIGTLLTRHLAARHPHLRDPLHYIATDAGIVLIRSGGTVSDGPADMDDHPQKFLRERLWTAARMLKKFTVPDLVELSLQTGEDMKRATNSAHRYLKALCRVRIIVELPIKERGTAVTSPGFKRFALLRDVGAMAPKVNFSCGIVFDPNGGNRLYFDKAGNKEAAA